MEEDFNIKVSVRNGRLLRAIRGRYDSVAELSRQLVRGRSQVNALVTMKLKPFNHKGWTDLALDVAAMVGKEPEDLWPDHLREFKLSKSTSEVEIDLDSVKQLIQDGTSEKSLSQISAISKLSENLTPRERQCMAMRWALGHTLDETARVFGVTRERVRQVEAKAIRKMKGAALVAGYFTTGSRHGEYNRVLNNPRTTNRGIDLLDD